jgi:hypothetical protein
MGVLFYGRQFETRKSAKWGTPSRARTNAFEQQALVLESCIFGKAGPGQGQGDNFSTKGRQARVWVL